MSTPHTARIATYNGMITANVAIRINRVYASVITHIENML